ncbi:hypothetical protein KEM56_006000 [Ascosphaera pollenicola]|nr:hypothetical protein KEM56_006000 [Ascosphaera pollenicola]
MHLTWPLAEIAGLGHRKSHVYEPPNCNTMARRYRAWDEHAARYMILVMRPLEGLMKAKDMHIDEVCECTILTDHDDRGNSPLYVYTSFNIENGASPLPDMAQSPARITLYLMPRKKPWNQEWISQSLLVNSLLCQLALIFHDTKDDSLSMNTAKYYEHLCRLYMEIPSASFIFLPPPNWRVNMLRSLRLNSEKPAEDLIRFGEDCQSQQAQE